MNTSVLLRSRKQCNSYSLRRQSQSLKDMKFAAVSGSRSGVSIFTWSFVQTAFSSNLAILAILLHVSSTPKVILVSSF